MPSVIQVAQNLENKYLNTLPKPTERRSNASYISTGTTRTSPETSPRRWSWPSICPQRLGAWGRKANRERRMRSTRTL